MTDYALPICDRAREKIETIDKEIVALLAARKAAVARLARAKADYRDSTFPQTIEGFLRQRTVWAREKGVNEPFIESLFRHILGEALAFEASLTKSKPN